MQCIQEVGEGLAASVNIMRVIWEEVPVTSQVHEATVPGQRSGLGTLMPLLMVAVDTVRWCQLRDVSLRGVPVM